MTSPTLDSREVERFDRSAAEWWDESGKFRPLHKIGPARLAFIRREMCARFARDQRSLTPFAGLRVLDIGCGGGLVAEPMTRLGATVTGIDPSAESIAGARRHAAQQGLAIDYRVGQVEHLVAEAACFDCVLCLEVVEHVPDPKAFIAEIRRLVAPGGLLVLSTLNRTLKAWALAIIGAEYILRWLPVGTHQWERFITPEELASHAEATGLTVCAREGLVFDPLRDRWLLAPDLDVNYLLAARD